MDKTSHILYELLVTFKHGIEEALRELESPSSTSGKNVAVKKPATKAENILWVLTNDPDFKEIVSKLSNANELTSTVIIAAATFPAEKFLTVRALKQRIFELGFIIGSFQPTEGHFNSAVLQITSRLKRKYTYGDRGKQIPIKPLMDNLRIEWGSKEANEIIDIKNAMPSQAKKPQYALRLNSEGREKALEILRQIGCTIASLHSIQNA